jgi:hypothetical protein
MLTLQTAPSQQTARDGARAWRSKCFPERKTPACGVEGMSSPVGVQGATPPWAGRGAQRPQTESALARDPSGVRGAAPANRIRSGKRSQRGAGRSARKRDKLHASGPTGSATDGAEGRSALIVARP